jgi:hypothetical protein
MTGHTDMGVLLLDSSFDTCWIGLNQQQEDLRLKKVFNLSHFLTSD